MSIREFLLDLYIAEDVAEVYNQHAVDVEVERMVFCQ